ncbi:MAG: hypothetical protein ACQEQF_00345 [Bacillota bacterium]
MEKDKFKIKIGVDTKLYKYGKGKNPNKDEPDEIIEKAFEVTGENAKKLFENISKKEDK